MIQLSQQANNITPSLLRSMSNECEKIKGINLGQGICKFPIDSRIKDAAALAIYEDQNSYSSPFGVSDLKFHISEKIRIFNKFEVDYANELIVTHGATAAFVCAVVSLFDKGDEVLLFEPFYPPHKHILNFFGVHTKTASINLDDFSIDIESIRKCITRKTKGMVICSPSNPCGKVFSQLELLALGEIAEQYNLCIIADEIYEHIVYFPHEHCSIASFPQFKPRTITISGLSKTFNMTGWRLGYASGPEAIIRKMSAVQDLLYVCPVTPLQYGAISAFTLPESYYVDLKEKFLQKRNYFHSFLQEIGFSVTLPQGSYYLLADIQALRSVFPGAEYFKNDDMLLFLLREAKVVSVNGNDFFDSDRKHHFIRFCYAVEHDYLLDASRKMKEAFKKLVRGK